MRTGLLLVWLPVMLAVASAQAAMPKDCSIGPIPDGPATLSIGDTKIPLPVSDVVQAGSMSFGEDGPTFVTYRLTLHDAKDLFAPVEVDVTFLVKEGERFDGTTFRRLPSDEIEDQPGPEPGTPAVQGWSVAHKDRELDLNHVLVVASLRLELGKRTGDTLPGKLRICVPGGQKQRIGSTVVADAVEVVGTFTATVK